MKQLITILFLVASMPLLAQLTITQSDFSSLVGVTKTRSSFITYDAGVIADMVAKSGAGQTWDLTGVSFTANGTATEQVVVGVEPGKPGATEFATATHHVKQATTINPDSINYFYFQLTSDALTALGIGTEVGGSPSTITYTPPYKALQFPLSLGTSWTAATAMSLSAFPGFEIPINHHFVVDGEGTLKLPSGQSKPVLRLRDSAYNSLSGSATIIYVFMGKTDREAATITVSPISSFPSSMEYYVGGGGGGGVREQKNNVFTLLPNTPNPFVKSTTIAYELHKDVKVTLVIHDQLGNEKAVLVNSFAAKGEHRVAFDAADLPSGHYYYTLTAGNEQVTMPMTLTR